VVIIPLADEHSWVLEHFNRKGILEMECNPKKIESLLEFPTKWLNRVYRPMITVFAMVFMLFVLIGFLSFLRYLHMDKTLGTADIFQIVSNVLIFGGTMLTLWEVIQSSSRKRNLQALDEAAALIEACMSSINSSSQKEHSSNAILGDLVKHSELITHRENEQRLRKTFKQDASFANCGAKFGVFVIFAGLVFTPYT